VFTDFDEEEDYEESERDTDYASAYEDESDDEDELEPLEEDDPDVLSSDWQVLGAADAARSRDTRSNPWDVEETANPEDRDVLAVGRFSANPDPEPFEEEDDYEEEADPDEDWDDEEADDPDDLEDDEPEDAAHEQRWPMGMVIVGLVALVLLVAGGYGVIQQRAAAQAEIRQLQASLATAASPAEVAASREALREMQQRSIKDQATIEALTLENRRLSDTAAGLEQQQKTQQAAPPKPAPAKAAPPRPAPAAAAPAAVPARNSQASAGSGDWFVNFSSYSQRGTADNWAKKLAPSSGKAVVLPVTRDGQTLYRVRVVGLANRAQAQAVAGQLQATHNLPALWVDRE
jgi:cell division septation protein DedD